MAFEAELVLQGPDDGLDALPQPIREGPGLLVLAGRADEGQVQVRAGEERLGVLAGQALISDDGGSRRGTVRRLAFQHLPGLLTLAVEFGIGQAETRDGPLAGHDQQQLGSPVPAGMAGAVAVPRPAVQVRALRGDGGLAARDRGGVHQPQQVRAGWRVVSQPAQRRFHQRRGGLDPVVVLALAQQPGKQVPDLPGRGAQPVPLVVIAQQHLRHGQAHQLGVGDIRRLARPGPGEPQRGDDAVSQLHVECGQESVQVGDHDDSQGQTCVDTPILDTLRSPVTDHQVACRDTPRPAPNNRDRYAQYWGRRTGRAAPPLRGVLRIWRSAGRSATRPRAGRGLTAQPENVSGLVGKYVSRILVPVVAVRLCARTRLVPR